jgi:hypothetical protein
MRYTLIPNVHMAVVEGDVVLLDSRSDRYACLPACDAGPVRAGYVARHWEDGPLVRELAEAGYLVPAEAPLPASGPIPLVPEHDLYTLAGDVPPLAPADLAGAAHAGLVALWRLRTQQPMRWLRSTGKQSGTDACVALARQFAQAHLYLPRLTRCLPHSLALVAFLKRRGSHAQLIFGVRTHPFEAHCWVQSGRVVLCDTVTHVRWFTPIAWS